MKHLPREEHDRLASLSDADKKDQIKEQVTRLHMAVFSGTYDTPVIEDALARLDALAGKAHPKAAHPPGTPPYADMHHPALTEPTQPAHSFIPEIVPSAPAPVTGTVTEATVQPPAPG